MINENTIITITTHCYINRHSSEKNVDRFLECQKYYIIILGHWYKRMNTKAYASPARQSATVMKISGHTHSEEF